MKAFLVHNENEFPLVLIAYAKGLSENHESISKIVKLINYTEHMWLICCDLKMVSLLFGFQQGYTSYMCIYCKWHTRTTDQKLLWSKNFEQRTVENSKKGEKSIVNEPPICFSNISKVIPPPLHIKIGIMYAFITAILNPKKCTEMNWKTI